MNQVFCLLVVSTALVTEAQYSYNTQLYQRQRPPSSLIKLAPSLPTTAIPDTPSDQTDSPAQAAYPTNAANYVPSNQASIIQILEVNEFNIAKLLRNQWELILPKIILESKHEKTAALIEEMVEVNPCVDSLDAYLEFLEQRIKSIEKISPEIESMLLKIMALQGEKNLGVILGAGADILDTLDAVAVGFVTSFGCQANAEVGVDALRSLALNLYRQSLVEDIPNVLVPTARQNLHMSARVTEAISNIVDHFSKNVAESSCYTSTNAFGDFIDVLGATLGDIGEAFGALEYFEGAKVIRQYSKFVLSIKDSLGDLPEFKTPGDCSPGAFKRNAAILREVAGIVRDVDIQTLFLETGVSFRLDLLP